MADNRLKSFVERIAKLHEDRKAIADDIAEVVKEAAGVGYIPKTLRKVVARYMADPAKLAEDDALLETYEAALGRVGKALKAVREGATWDEASEATGVPRATLARAEAVSKRREMIPEDAGTGSATVVATGNLDALSPAGRSLLNGEDLNTKLPKPEDGDDGITGGKDGKAKVDHSAGQENVVRGQSDAKDAVGHERSDGASGNGRDDFGEDGGGLRGVGAAQDQLKKAASQGSSRGPDTPPEDAVAGTSEPVPDGEVGASTHSDDDLAIPIFLRAARKEHGMDA